MSDLDGWVPLREWEPEVGETVVDRRFVDRGGPDKEVSMQRGTVLDCRRYGHFADPYWRASVRWSGGGVEQNIETSCLTREDGSQGRRG